MNERKKTVAFHTLGCKLNFSETSEIGRQLEDEGYKQVRFGEKADVSVIHTCSVTVSADRKTRQAIKKAVKASPEGFVVAMGCYAQLRTEEAAALEGVDLVLGTRDKFDLPKYLKETDKKGITEVHSCDVNDITNFFPAYSSGERTRAFLKVQDGCDYSCSYCTIPAARGKSRNPDIDLLIRQAANIASKGISEIVLTGVNIGDFGRSTGQSFKGLIKELENIDSEVRFRISSIEPNLLSDEIIEHSANSEKICPHFHIPLQSGSDKILGLMRRRYIRSVFEERTIKIKSVIPDACIGADVIVGFPGETDDVFNETYDFLSGLDISYLHVFTYSERPGTPATELKPIIPNRIRDERSKIMHDLSDRKKAAFYNSCIGDTRKVIFERRGKDGRIIGFTDNYIEVATEAEEKDLSGFNKVKLISFEKGLMSGKI